MTNKKLNQIIKASFFIKLFFVVYTEAAFFPQFLIVYL